VAQGGHDIPIKDVKRRFERSGRRFFKDYRLFADRWILFNNEGSRPEIIARKQNAHIDIIDSGLFAKITEEIGVEL